MGWKCFAACLPAVLAACATELGITKAEPGKGNVGIEYSLPMTQFDITIRRRIASCRDDATGVEEMVIAAEFEAVPRSVPDPSATFVIDPGSLSHFFNTAMTSVEF